MNPIRLALLALALAGPALAAAPPAKKASVELKIGGDTAVVVKSLPCTVTAPAGADFYFWSLPDGVKGAADENVLTVTAAPAGDSTISVVSVTTDFTVGKDGKVTKIRTKDSGSVVLTNGSAPPAPGPTPPGPVPPAPPQPPAPIPAAGLHVLIVYDATAPRPQALESILKGKEVRDYLNAKCGLDADGKTRAYRIWPRDADPSGDDKVWADAFGRDRKSTPWILVSDGKTGYEGPLPATPAAVLDLLKKYEGK